MLYLMRKVGESIVINGNIEVKLIEVKGKGAKIGFEFPTDVTVLRKEVHDRIAAENLAASTPQAMNEGDMSDLEAFSQINMNLTRRKEDMMSSAELKARGEVEGNHPARRKSDKNHPV